MQYRIQWTAARALRRTALAAGALLASAGAAGAQQAFDWEEAMRPGQTLRVFSVHGEIAVRRASGGVARVRGRGRSDARGRSDIRFETRRLEDGVVVCALYDGASTCGEDGVRTRSGERSRGGRADFVVEVPQGVDVAVGSGNGDVDVTGASGDVTARSGNGRVRVGAGAGTVRAVSGNGEVSVEDARASVDATSGNGDIRVTTAAGPVSASTGNGSIEVRMASLRESGDMRFRSGNGSVTLFLPGDFAAELSARTGHGAFEVDFPLRTQGRISPSRLEGTIGSAARRVTISTGNGSIRLHRME